MRVRTVAIVVLGFALAAGGARAESEKKLGKEVHQLQQADDTFLMRASEQNLAALQLSRSALYQAKAKEVRSLAKELVDHDSQVGYQLDRLAEQDDIMLPGSPSKSLQRGVDAVVKETGATLDRSYLQEILKVKRATLSLYDGESDLKPGSYARQFAARERLPLQQQIEKIEQVMRTIE